MRIITFNANGIRAATRKGFFQWFENQNADILCIQETKAQRNQLDDPSYHPKGYDSYFFDAEKKGYSGVAIYSRHKPNSVMNGLDFSIADTEGRYIQLDFNNLSIASIYLPSGSSGDERQTIKMQFLDYYEKILSEQINNKIPMIICGDMNIVHKEIDIKNFKSNQKNSGCLPEERAWLDKVFDQIGWVDAFRVINQQKDQYTWWSNRGRARENNVGWRLDYQWITPCLKEKITHANVYKEAFFSDHAPLVMDYEYIIN
ncbi:exodeoxyribonuclease III [Thiotrichales bacterium 19S11-10]|nr:exodeoxyribonuclease III [Thiotrichales bacterium 19S11-10]MCF6806932.1 exodeoxyribonuclease III [Thiotrichales bacterium 19S9-11]MCF6810901.1 exodeoxyribonuclease III [Thiotrichales bacterium 19S9-12]